MENFIIESDNAPDIEFEGELVGSGSTAGSDPYNRATRWTVYKIYRTKGGKFVGWIVGRTQWSGEVDRYNAKVCNDERSLIEFLGYSDAAKEAYDEAGISATVKVE